MSAKGRSVLPPNESEVFETPTWCVDRLLESHELPQHGLMRWLEPCAGDGAIIKATQNYAKRTQTYDNITWHANELRPDIDTTAAPCWWTSNYLTWDPERLKEYHVVISNPPFSLAQEVIVKSWGAKTICMLLRVNFLGSIERSHWLRNNMPDVLVLPNRPPFSLNKHGKLAVDATEYAWFIWPEQRERIHGRVRILNETSEMDLKRHRVQATAKLLALKAQLAETATTNSQEHPND